MRRCSCLQVVRKMQIKAVMGYCLSPIRSTKTGEREEEHIQCWRWTEEMVSCVAGRYVIGIAFWRQLGITSEKAMAPHSSTLAWKIPWTGEPGRLLSMGSHRVEHDWATSLSLFTFHTLEKEMATHSSVLAWRIPGTGEPGGLPSLGSHRVGHDWSDLAAAGIIYHIFKYGRFWPFEKFLSSLPREIPAHIYKAICLR